MRNYKFGLTMAEMKKHIVQGFNAQYGFAPTMKAIIPLESIGENNNITWLGFSVNGVGYDCHYQGGVHRNENYDM